MKTKRLASGAIKPISAVTIEIPVDGTVVFNLRLEGGEDRAEHFFVANDIVTGDLYLQENLTPPGLSGPRP